MGKHLATFFFFKLDCDKVKLIGGVVWGVGCGVGIALASGLESYSSGLLETDEEQVYLGPSPAAVTIQEEGKQQNLKDTAGKRGWWERGPRRESAQPLSSPCIHEEAWSEGHGGEILSISSGREIWDERPRVHLEGRYSQASSVT